MTNINLKINKEDFKRKLNIKDGERGVDGKDGETPDTSSIALEASKIALDELKPLIPIIIPETPEQTVDKVNLSKTKVHKEAVEGLADIERMARENAVPVTTSFFNGNRAKNLNIVGGVATQQGDTVSIDSTVFNDDRYVNVTGDTMTGALTLANLANALNSGDYPVQMMSGVADGASAVGYSFDTTNDLLTSGAKLLKLSSANSEKITVLGNGNVGIGYTTPSSKLDIAGDVSIATIGAEMIANIADRDFSAVTGNWSGTNWTIAAGVATHTVGGIVNFTLSSTAFSPSIVSGSYYQVTFDVTTTVVGTIRPQIGTSNGQDIGTTIGTVTGHKQIIQSSGNTLVFRTVFWQGSIDNVSVKLVTKSNPVQTLRNSDFTNSLEFRSGGSGLNNVILGINAGQSITSGGSNTFIGGGAGLCTTTGITNLFIGGYTGYSNVNGFNNVFIGATSGQNNISGNGNLFIGRNTGYSNVLGSYNTFIGNNIQGTSITNTSIAIGYQSTVTANNQLIIGSADADGSITDAYFGQGVVKTTPTGITINPTGGSGTNNVGASLTIAGGKSTGNALGGSIIFSTANVGASGTTLQSITEKARFLYNGNFGLGVSSPTAVLHLKAGTATANTAPLKFTSGALLTAPVAGVVEFLTDNYYATITTGAKRKTIEFQENYSQSFLLMGA